MKVYAVKKGFKTGIFDNWPDCQAATKGYSNPEYKSFVTKEEAQAYIEGVDLWKKQVSELCSNGYLVAFTDGSYDEKINRYGYGVVIITPEGNEDTICGYGCNSEYISSKNIIGEIFGVINAIDWAVTNDYSKIIIFHDYEGISKWITGEWKTKTTASQMFVNLFKAKFEGIIQVEFNKIPGHSNISYNERADRLAHTALVSMKKTSIQGPHWYSIPYYPKSDLSAFVELVKESDNNIKCTIEESSQKYKYRFTLNNDSVTVTLFKGGKHSLLVQGKNTYLFQILATFLVEVGNNSKPDKILGSAYRVSVNSEKIDKSYEMIQQNFPANYPPNIGRLVRQSIINLNYSIECEDYAQYAFPALRALEGHIKYLIQSAGGGQVTRRFCCFNRLGAGSSYFYSGRLSDPSKKTAIEKCYNYYKAQRDTIFHFGDIIGNMDSTRTIATKEEADEIINCCIELICDAW